ncbi:polysaccharide deacetylase family protein [Paracraurococcus lichenis]|uniref:Polysaccharide deacetylase family protein n=1 Tax=Paracraurococcus lichenis TaxID=3064888 RepID=A0ABT9DT40_9PROT|nr:polysaccharide deacetylase family protein [Paracraurococcus sp. LOR1-02]MDO9707043.1 polysaccharide deacetylase family protein [Paracraurococcus sp. LOR1-02]
MTASSPLAARLGLARAAIPHVDDLGMCHAGNRAFLDLAARGLVTCGAVMVPCPWFAGMAEAAAADPALDLGVHLTLTSEWRHYRWAPLTTRSPASGLVDADGYFWRDLDSLRRHLVPEAAEAELRAQVERALAAGLRPTHLDAHMAGAMLPELLPCHVALAREIGAVPVLPRRIRFAPDPAAYERCVAALEAAGLPLPDGIHGTLAVPAEEARAGYERMIRTLPEGVTHLALHAATPGDIEAIAPDHAGWRMREYALLAEGAVAAWCREAGVALLGYRAIQPFWPALSDAPAGRAAGGPAPSSSPPAA